MIPPMFGMKHCARSSCSMPYWVRSQHSSALPSLNKAGEFPDVTMQSEYGTG